MIMLFVGPTMDGRCTSRLSVESQALACPSMVSVRHVQNDFWREVSLQHFLLFRRPTMAFIFFIGGSTKPKPIPTVAPPPSPPTLISPPSVSSQVKYVVRSCHHSLQPRWAFVPSRICHGGCAAGKYRRWCTRQRLCRPCCGTEGIGKVSFVLVLIH